MVMLTPLYDLGAVLVMLTPYYDLGGGLRDADPLL